VVRRKLARSTSEIDALVGKRLKARRLTLGLSQAAVAAKVGISYQQVHKYEMGQNKVYVGRLIQFCKVLEVPVRWFLKDIPIDPGLPKDLVDLLSDPLVVRLLMILRSAPDERARKDLVAMAKTIVDAHNNNANEA